ncbi:MAG: hypothetical protein IJV71_08680, partial [Lachnospiraceae bacterium]|nr:hypothetical protein [Lachnospiraceae bacterium]
MNIRIIKNVMESNDSYIRDEYMIQTQIYESGYEKIEGIKIFLYDLNKNVTTEVAASIPKYNLIDIKDINKDTSYIFFTSIEKSEDSQKHNIMLYRYSILTEQCDKIYSFEESLDKYADYMRTKVFIINEYYFLIQNEFLRANLTEEYADYLEYEIYMYSINEGKSYKITDERFTRYGIMSLQAVSANNCVIKLGYDLLKDSRYKIFKKNEAAMESVSFVNIGQMVSDILLGQQEIVLNTIENVYYSVTIPYVKLDNDYIIYSKVKLDEKLEEEIIFYNLTTKDTTICINNNIKDTEKPAHTCIICDTPYIIRNGAKGSEFIDVKGKNATFYINKDDEISNIIGNIMIVDQYSKGVFGKVKPCVTVYKLPHLKVLHREKGRHIASTM